MYDLKEDESKALDAAMKKSTKLVTKGKSRSNALLYSVDKQLMKRIYFALETARDNAIELYNDHMQKLGVITEKNKHLAKVLKDDAEEVTDLIKGLTDKYGKFGI